MDTDVLPWAQMHAGPIRQSSNGTSGKSRSVSDIQKFPFLSVLQRGHVFPALV